MTIAVDWDVKHQNKQTKPVESSALNCLFMSAFKQASDKSVYWKSIFFISHPKHMLWVLKRTVSMKPKTHV